jgi:glutaredoxin
LSDATIIYTLRSCPTCKRAKEGLAADGVEFEERDITTKGTWNDGATDLEFSVPIIVRSDTVELGWKGDHG